MSNDPTGDPTMSAPETPPERGGRPQRRSGSERRVTPDRRVVTLAPSPWRRRKRLRPWVLLSNTTNVLILLGFSGLVLFACWEAQSRAADRPHKEYRAHVRPGGSATPLPEADAPKQ